MSKRLKAGCGFNGSWILFEEELTLKALVTTTLLWEQTGPADHCLWPVCVVFWSAVYNAFLQDKLFPLLMSAASGLRVTHSFFRGEFIHHHPV